MNEKARKTILCIAGFLVIAGCQVPQFSATRDFEKVVPVSSQLEVVAKTFNGSITVTPTDKPEISIVAHAKSFGMTQEEADEALDGLSPVIDTSGGKLTIECKKRNPTNLGFSDSVSLELQVPVGWPLKLATSNGNVTVGQMFGSVSIQTSNGKVEVFEATGSVEASTSNGKIFVANSSGTILANTSNGSIYMMNCNLEGKCSLKTSNGSIKARFANHPDLPIRAKTSNGIIDCKSSEIRVENKSKNTLSGILLGTPAVDGSANASLEMETSNGSIKINPEEELKSIDLSARAPAPCLVEEKS